MDEDQNVNKAKQRKGVNKAKQGQRTTGSTDTQQGRHAMPHPGTAQQTCRQDRFAFLFHPSVFQWFDLRKMRIKKVTRKSKARQWR
jgi:hypothetical protein